MIEAEAAELLEVDPAMAERFYGNRIRAGASRAVDMEVWASNADPDHRIPDGALVTIGTDGARFSDAIAVVATEVATGFQQALGIGEVPADLDADARRDYQHDKAAVDDELAAAHDRWTVWRNYVDPGGIDEWMQSWQGRWGNTVVVPWHMHRRRPTAFAVRRWLRAVAAHDQSHAGQPDLTRHVRNAHRQPVQVYDDDHRQMFVLAKERHDSPDKMDGAAASVLSWEARGDAIAAGATAPSLPPVVVGM